MTLFEKIISITFSAIVLIVSGALLFKNLLQNFLVAKIRIVEATRNIEVCVIILSIKKLDTKAIKAPTENQNTRKPVVALSIIRNIPAMISHIFHIIFPPNKNKQILFNYTINEYKNK